MHTCQNCGSEINDTQVFCDDECEAEYHGEYLNEPCGYDDQDEEEGW